MKRIRIGFNSKQKAVHASVNVFMFASFGAIKLINKNSRVYPLIWTTIMVDMRVIRITVLLNVYESVQTHHRSPYFVIWHMLKTS